ncbi:hypothetical protein [Algihabitans sp.]|uniref:hypothetical protein n=1 Tax=Algihabitans sp. TaxID=2821514 RepID=UPI003BA977A8
MGLFDFLNSPRHFVAREKLLHLRAAYEMKLAAARSGEQLLMTEPEIDNSGHDFVASINYDLLYVQNKSTLSGANVNAWNVHPKLLQVPYGDRDISPQIDHSPIGGIDGAMGGVLLHEIDSEAAQQDKLKISYFYFDIFFAAAVQSGLWVSPNFCREKARSIMEKIAHGERGDRISLPKQAMLPIRSPAALVAFRFHLPWPSNWISLGRLSNEQPEVIKNHWRSEIGQWVTQQ